MKHLKLFSVVAILFFGCVGKPYTPADLESDVKGVVRTAAIVRLTKHPEKRPAWIRAESAMGLLVRNEDWNLNSFTTAFLVGSADRIQNDTVVISIQAGVLAITTSARGQVNLEDPVWAKAAITGAYAGIGDALKIVLPPPES